MEPITVRPKHLLVLAAVLVLISLSTLWWGLRGADWLLFLRWGLGVYVLFVAGVLDLLALLWLGIHHLRRQFLRRRTSNRR